MPSDSENTQANERVAYSEGYFIVILFEYFMILS